MTTPNTWSIFVDTGGTFTDCLGQDVNGEWHRAKVLSDSTLRGSVERVLSKERLIVSNCEHYPASVLVGMSFWIQNEDGDKGQAKVVSYNASSNTLTLDHALANVTSGSLFSLSTHEEAPVLGIRILTNTPVDQSFPPMDLRLATTKATNALLEHKVAPTVLFITKGFADLLILGTQQREHLFKLSNQNVQALYTDVIEVPERLNSNGQIHQVIDVEAIEQFAKKALDKGINHAAISFLHSYLNPEHEKTCARFLKELGFDTVVTSSELSQKRHFLERTETCVIDAVLSPIMNEYLDNIIQVLSDVNLLIMASSGGLVKKQSFHPKDSLLSGPAGGVVAARAIGKQCLEEKMIAFDMGGTSTDVTRIDSHTYLKSQLKINNHRLVAPVQPIETIAAGGGSICYFKNQKIHVGPESASAKPGPACYGYGGPLTVTDVNLLLGRLYPPLLRFPMSLKSAKEQFNKFKEVLVESTGTLPEDDETLSGLVSLANEHMAGAIRSVSVREGYDPADYALLVFGGAGGQHACSVAQKLGIQKILVPKDAGLLSAIGLESARVERIETMHTYELLDKLLPTLDAKKQELIDRGRAKLSREGMEEHQIMVQSAICNLRLEGQESTLPVAVTDSFAELPRHFSDIYQNTFGYEPRLDPLELVSLEVTLCSIPIKQRQENFDIAETNHFEPVAYTEVCFDSGRQPAPIYNRQQILSGEKLSGPAIIVDAFSTLLVEPGWHATSGSEGTLKLEAYDTDKFHMPDQNEIIMLEIVSERLGHLVEEMGLQLRRTATSTNIKERLDFSCALLDSMGYLIVNAPHVPVHLGALGICMRRVLEEVIFKPGDMIITNHPGYGGSHLPDVTVISPIFGSHNKLLGFLANRAHHAEIGGLHPGSLSPEARCLQEEGVMIPPVYLFQEGVSKLDDLEKLLRDAPHPSRAVEDNLADINAQIAANRRGLKSMNELLEQFGESVLLKHMDQLLQRADRALRECLRNIPDRVYEDSRILVDDLKLQIKIKKEAETIHFDFTGSSPPHSGNLNATSAIVQSTIIYFLRLLVQENIPLNEGLLRATQLILPCSFLSPDFSADAVPAVSAGNVEVSQQLINCLLTAMKFSAASQGTMNNLTFGNNQFSYYETIGGGAGGSHQGPGAHGLQTHMTNTAITDPEILESRFPIRLEQYALRTHSGGSGKFPGGEGVIRHFTFLEPLAVSILSHDRDLAPKGIGGSDGKKGAQILITKSGSVSQLPSFAFRQVNAHDQLVIKTPGGGGYGI
ncbi:MAG: hydantoinase B/oxoprolinase family protein [Verrucomicrobiota bacterium]